MQSNNFFELRPVLGGLPEKRRAPKFLLVAFFEPHGINTITEYVANWQRFTKFNFIIANLWPNRAGGSLALPSDIDLVEYDGIVLHPTVSYFPANLLALDQNLKCKLKDYTGLKVLVKQDEHYHSAVYPKYIADNRFDVLVTCVPPAELEKVYPKDIVGNIVIVHALTGYVAPALRRMSHNEFEKRSVDIAYRGSVQPLSFGRLGFEKRKIGFDVVKAVAGHDLNLDISSRWKDRVGGSDWYNFLGRSKIVLGVESGSNLFDFYGEVEDWCKHYAEKQVGLDPESEEYYLNAHNSFLFKFEGSVDYAQISPRHLEAASTRSVQLLYEGRYSGIFLPNRHYLPLKRDLSNLEECLDILNDPTRAKQITDAAFEEIILNDEYRYESFVARLDQVLDGLLSSRMLASPHRAGAGADVVDQEGKTAEAAIRPRALVMMSHEPELDPRIRWISAGFIERGFEVVEIGCHQNSASGASDRFEQLSKIYWRVYTDRMSHSSEFVCNPAHLDVNRNLTPNHLVLLLKSFASMSADLLADRLGSIGADDGSLEKFRWYCEYCYNSNSALVEAANLIGKFDVVVCADLDVLPGALVLAKRFAAVCVYDSHEYWKGTFAQEPWAHDFWAYFEYHLVGLSDICVTVSPPLARQLSLEYSANFLSVPNCEMRLLAKSEKPSHADDPTRRQGDVVFLYQGSFHPDRPIGRLIQSWAQTEENAVLWLRGPDWSHRGELIELAQQTGLLGTRIFFPEAVSEADLVTAAAKADVGIIPYDPAVHIGYRYACPNKLSQYLAAGLPILTSSIDYVASTVRANELGLVFDWNDAGSFVSAVNKLTMGISSRAAFSARAKRFFDEQFNWEVVSKPLYDEITSRLTDRAAVESPLNFAWTLKKSAKNAAKRHLAAQKLADQKLAELAPNESVGSLRRLARLSISMLPSAMQAGIRKAFHP